MKIMCRWCKKGVEVNVTAAQLERLHGSHDLIQNVLPEVSVDDREMLMTQTCKACWKAMWDEEAIEQNARRNEEETEARFDG
jgi:hypothetical protein